MFSWHGGEPLLAGLDFFHTIIELQHAFFGNSFLICNCVQTNGTLINDEWAKFFKDHDFEVGISVDGMRDLHDKYRPFRNGKGTYDRVARNVGLLREIEVPLRALCVIHPEANGREVFDHIVSLGFQFIDFLPLIANWETKDWYPSFNVDIGSFLIDAFDAWYELDDPQIRVRWFADLIVMILGHPAPGLCTLKDHCSGHLTIDYDGAINNCECLNICGQSIFNFNSNVWSSSFAEVEKIESFLLLTEGFKHIGKTCLECEAYSLCKGGCPSTRYKNNSFKRPSIYCKSFRRLAFLIRNKVMSDPIFQCNNSHEELSEKIPMQKENREKNKS